MISKHKPTFMSKPGATKEKIEPLEVWVFDHAELKAELKSIQHEFPSLGPNGWLTDEGMAAAAKNHRDPFMDMRFMEQVARGITYMMHAGSFGGICWTDGSPGLHQALVKHATGASLQLGAMISAHLLLKGSVRDVADRNKLRMPAIMTQCDDVPLSLVRRT